MHLTGVLKCKISIFYTRVKLNLNNFIRFNISLQVVLGTIISHFVHLKEIYKVNVVGPISVGYVTLTNYAN